MQFIYGMSVAEWTCVNGCKKPTYSPSEDTDTEDKTLSQGTVSAELADVAGSLQADPLVCQFGRSGKGQRLLQRRFA